MQTYKLRLPLTFVRLSGDSCLVLQRYIATELAALVNSGSPPLPRPPEQLGLMCHHMLASGPPRTLLWELESGGHDEILSAEVA